VCPSVRAAQFGLFFVWQLLRSPHLGLNVQNYLMQCFQLGIQLPLQFRRRLNKIRNHYSVEPACNSCHDTIDTVLQHNAVFRGDLKVGGDQKKQFGVRLSMEHLVAKSKALEIGMQTGQLQISASSVLMGGCRHGGQDIFLMKKGQQL